MTELDTRLEAAIRAALRAALLKRRAFMSARAAEGTTSVEDYPTVSIRTPEAALAERMAAEYGMIAAEI